jgi:hypothetical protein
VLGVSTKKYINIDAHIQRDGLTEVESGTATAAA